MESKRPPSRLKALLLTREYPPDVYGGAGVHVEYLARELAQRIRLEVRTFGEQQIQAGNLVVQGHRYAQAESGDTPEKFLPALQALRVCLSFNARRIDADIVHCHTWYTHFGGLLARMLYGIPLVITAHSLEERTNWIGSRPVRLDRAHSHGGGRQHRGGLSADAGRHPAPLQRGSPKGHRHP